MPPVPAFSTVDVLKQADGEIVISPIPPNLFVSEQKL